MWETDVSPATVYRSVSGSTSSRYPRCMSTSATPRERLLDAAGELFYRDGVNIGVDALCEAAGVSKKSMYQLFRSKDELIAESLASRGPAYQALLHPGAEDY